MGAMPRIGDYWGGGRVGVVPVLWFSRTIREAPPGVAHGVVMVSIIARQGGRIYLVSFVSFI